MNFTTLSNDLAKEFKMPKRTALKMITFLMKRMREKLIFGQHIKLHQIGTIKLRVRKSKPYPDIAKNKMQISKKKYYLFLEVTQGLKDDLTKKTVY